MISTGLKGHSEVYVTSENTALAVGSGTLEVFATPCMAALMEKAACQSLTPFLEKGQNSVGTHLDISHISASPLGMKVWAESIVTNTEGRKVVFDVKAFDGCGLIGSGTHERFIIDEERFMKTCHSKSNR